MVRRELRFDTFRRQGVGCGHDAGVVDEAVYWSFVAVDFFSGFPDLGLLPEIQFEESRRRAGSILFDRVFGLARFVEVTPGQHH